MADGRTTLLILAMIQFGMGMMGYGSGFDSMMNNWFGGFGVGNPTMFLGAITVGILGAAGAGVVASYLSSNFGVIYAIPATIAQGVILVLFLTPMTFLTEGSIPYPVNILLDIIFGVMVLFTIFSFVRGGEL
jgi:hypothetical protein